jgi:Lar family restriction alleviation protein
MKELRDCPFCGEPEEIEVTQDENSLDNIVQCNSCGSRTQEFAIEKHAVEAWNTRATEDKLVEALKSILRVETQRGELKGRKQWFAFSLMREIAEQTLKAIEQGE